MIPFNKPFVHGNEIKYIAEVLKSGKLCGDGSYTKKVHELFSRRYCLQKVLLTTSCTDALEMASLLLNISAGDEVIMPSYTFVSTANAFALRGAKIIFADSESFTPNIDASKIESLITARTKAIIIVHYAGVACDMDSIMNIANSYGIPVIEDAAQAVDSYYKGKPLGSIGILGAFSFHETKNIIAGEGGLLCINDPKLNKKAEIIREKGTNRSAFFRGEVDKYGWVSVGSSFLPSDIIAAFLYAQLEVIDEIQTRRKKIWELYNARLAPLAKKTGRFTIQIIPNYATNNCHMFYILCESMKLRNELIDLLKSNGISAAFHYQALHRSTYYSDYHDKRNLENCDRYNDTLMRLPFYFELTDVQINNICDIVEKYFS